MPESITGNWGCDYASGNSCTMSSVALGELHLVHSDESKQVKSPVSQPWLGGYRSPKESLCYKGRFFKFEWYWHLQG